MSDLYTKAEEQQAQQHWIIQNFDTLRPSVAVCSRELYDKVVTAVLEVLQQLITANETIERLEKLTKYAAHKGSCIQRYNDSRSCDCGFKQTKQEAS